MKKSRTKAGIPLRRGGDPFGFGGKPEARDQISAIRGQSEALTAGALSSDVVPAMLTPREAVLNRNGAELIGRGTVRKANAAGNELAGAGVDLASMPGLKFKGYVRGAADLTSDIGSLTSGVEPIGYNDPLASEKQWAGAPELRSVDLSKLSQAKQRQGMFSPEVVKGLLSAANAAGLFGGGAGNYPSDPGLASGGFAQGTAQVPEPIPQRIMNTGRGKEAMFAMGTADVPPYPPELAGKGLEYHGDGGGWYGSRLDVEDDYTRWTTPFGATHENAPDPGKELIQDPLRLAQGEVDIPPANMGYETTTPGGGGMGYYDPNYGYGGGKATQNVIGLLAGTGANFAFPGAGLVAGPLARMFTRMAQRAGGQQDPMTGGGDETGGSDTGLTADSGSLTSGLRGPAIHYSAGGIPAPGGWGGSYGGGSGGDARTGFNYDYFGRQGLKALLSGRDPTLGLPGFRNTGNAGVLPLDKWGGTGLGAFGNTFGTGAVNPDFKERSAR